MTGRRAVRSTNNGDHNIAGKFCSLTICYTTGSSAVYGDSGAKTAEPGQLAHTDGGQ